jgi:hypothetical protein
MVEPVLEDLIATAHPHKKPTQVDHLILLLSLFDIAENWFGKSTHYEGEYLLKRNHHLLLF